MVEREYIIRRRHRGNQLFWGVTLIALGTITALDHLRLLPFGLGGQNWPVLLIVLGCARAVTAWSARKLGSGVTIALMGGVCWIAANGWHGFTWQSTWPLWLVAAGGGMTAGALAVPFYRMAKRDHDEADHVL